MHGGRRNNAGRKRIGETKRISLTLPNEYWNEIDKKDINSLAEYIRFLIIADIDNTKNVI